MATLVIYGFLKRLFGTSGVFFTVLALIACTDNDPTYLPHCEDHLATGDLGAFSDEGNGLVSNPAVQPWFYARRGSVSSMESAGKGSALKLSRCAGYAEEISAASSGRWRLPEAEEMHGPSENGGCAFPAFNPTVFPALPVENFLDPLHPGNEQLLWLHRLYLSRIPFLPSSPLGQTSLHARAGTRLKGDGNEMITGEGGGPESTASPASSSSTHRISASAMVLSTP